MKTQQTQLGNAVHSSSHTAGIHYVSCSLTLFLPACLLRPSFLHPLHAPFLHTVSARYRSRQPPRVTPRLSSLTQRDLSIWDVTRSTWSMVAGEFHVEIGAASDDMLLQTTLSSV